MQAIRMMGVCCKNLSVDPLSLGQPPSAVAPKSILQHALDDPILP
ncbi:MAG TPA: hypothetical protein VN924_31050 [Bryobacteraceae bacterium]|nr:hypothetical protein [Bryobacteraceae bacterium]